MSQYTLTVSVESAWQVARIALLADAISDRNVAIAAGFGDALEYVLDTVVEAACHCDNESDAKRFQDIVETLRRYAVHVEGCLSEDETLDEELISDA